MLHLLYRIPTKENMKLQFKKLSERARLPKYAHDGDSGMDVYATDSKTIPPYSFIKMPLNLACNIPTGYELQVRPRSGLAAKHGVACVFGTVDMGYRGDIGVTLFNHTNTEVRIEKGDRIAQLVLAPIVRAHIVETDTLDNTERGANGFGSTGR